MKQKELIGLSVEELNGKLEQLALELMKLNSQVASGTTPKSPGQIKKIKKTIARINTIKKQKSKQNE